MSRGLGRTQRQALHYLHRYHPHTFTVGLLADLIYGDAPTPTQKAATRRALAALARVGLVVRDRQRRWRYT